jgi:hypothetical protein
LIVVGLDDVTESIVDRVLGEPGVEVSIAGTGARGLELLDQSREAVRTGLEIRDRRREVLGHPIE